MTRRTQIATRRILVLCRLALIFAGIFYVTACASALGPKQVGPVGTWQQDIRGLAAYIKADEAFWNEQRAVEEPIDWTAKIFDIEHRMVSSKPGNIIIWLEVPYTKEQTQAGLGPMPVQVVIAPESSLANKVQEKKFKIGNVVSVKGIFKGFVYIGREHSGKETKVTLKGNDTASALGFLFKQLDAINAPDDPMVKAEAYAKAKGLPFQAFGSKRIILPLLEVMPEEIDLIK